jgi:hypothetical protein
MSQAAADPLNRWERLGLFGLVVAALAFGVLTELRSAFLRRPMTDVQVYFRAAWAVRTGHDPYTVADDNNWHYNYPPFSAIVLAPLADAPPGYDRAGLVPYGFSVGLWYVLSLLALAWGVHVLARALEEELPEGRRPVPYGRRWWRLRLVPVFGCLPPVALTLNRGQVNLFVLAALCAALAGLLRGRRTRAGLWLAGAACVKVIPAFLALLPLLRRDRRCLAGGAAGLALGLGVLPVAVLGPSLTAEYYREWAEALAPGLGLGDSQARAGELTDQTATHSQSIQAVLHNTLHMNIYTRPPHPSPAVVWTSRAAVLLLTGLTLWAGWRRRNAPGCEALTFGLLTVVMLLASPVSHQHYFTLVIPLMTVLLALQFERNDSSRIGRGLGAVMLVNVVLSGVPLYPTMLGPRDAGTAMYATLLVWGYGLVTLWRLPEKRLQVSETRPEPVPVAA